MPELRLEGLAEPILANYLAALGVFRALAEQADPEATLRFDVGEVPVVETRLDADAWVRWVLTAWIPSPVASPWNSGAGFYGNSRSVLCKDGAKRNGVELVSATTDPRLASYRQVLSWCRHFLDVTKYVDTKDKVKDKVKGAFLARMRNEAPEAFLPWLDAVGVVEESRGRREARFLSLLGSGGNEGAFDLGNNFMIQLCRLLDLDGGLIKRPKKPAAWSEGLLRAFLGHRATGLLDDSAGQFAPAGREAPNADSGSNSFKGKKQLNPWLFVWAIEGSLLFRGASTRRLGSHGRAKAAFPFHADRVEAGFGSASHEKGKDELWLPLWNRPTSAPEVRRLFGEARAQVGRRRARDGLDYARAVAGLGAVRGLTGFQRFAILERAGQSNIAVHSGLYNAHSARVLDRLREIDEYILQYQSLVNGAPARFGSALRRFEDATLELARRPAPARVTALLAALGRMRREEAAGLPSKERLPPFRLRSSDWLEAAEASPELRIASALAALDEQGSLARLRDYLSPSSGVALENTARLRLAPLARAVLRRRLLDHSDPPPGQTCRPAGGDSAVRADDILLWQQGHLDEALCSSLLWCLAELPPAILGRWLRHQPSDAALPATLSRGWMLLRLSVEGSLPDAQGTPLRPPRGILETWAAHNPRAAIARATHALRAAGRPPSAVGLDRVLDRAPSPQALASLAVPLPRHVLAAMADLILARPMRSEPTSKEMTP